MQIKTATQIDLDSHKKLRVPESPRKCIFHVPPKKTKTNSGTSERLPDSPTYRKYGYEERGQFRANEEKLLRL